MGLVLVRKIFCGISTLLFNSLLIALLMMFDFIDKPGILLLNPVFVMFAFLRVYKIYDTKYKIHSFIFGVIEAFACVEILTIALYFSYHTDIAGVLLLQAYFLICYAIPYLLAIIFLIFKHKLR